MRRWRNVATAWLLRAADARIGSRQTELEQARWSTHDFAVFSAVLTTVYLVFYLTHDDVWFGSPVFVATACIAAQVGAVILARRGQQLAAALLSIVTAMIEILASVAVLGWESGVHLYLIAAGVLVFVVFTARQSAWRWFFIVVAATAFILGQTVVEPSRPDLLPPDIVADFFSFNAVLTALLVFALSGLSYNRANQARAESARNASRAEYLANTDALTGLSNRRPLIERLDAVSARGKGDYSVAIADLDRFKVLNDTYGHDCGDTVLAHVSSVLKSRLRTTDAVGRWGGEEFIVVLPETAVEHAVRLMERLRASVESLRIPCNGHEHAVTVSIGVADGGDDAQWHRVVKRADDALYDAKTEGRNLVRSSPRTPAAP
jgi:diguanylate cyclase (GGDEF)-like protein